MKLIDKDALVVEIKRRIEKHKFLAAMVADNNLHNTLEANELLIRNYNDLMYFINTLEVKEVDLEKEIELWMKSNGDDAGYFNTLEFAKHFFELGLADWKDQHPREGLWDGEKVCRILREIINSDTIVQYLIFDDENIDFDSVLFFDDLHKAMEETKLW